MTAAGAAMNVPVCNVCGCSPCASPSFCRACREADRKAAHKLSTEVEAERAGIGRRRREGLDTDNSDPRGNIPPAASAEDFESDGAEENSAADNGGVRLEDFLAYMPKHVYIFTPSCEFWPAASVNARVAPVIGPGGKPSSPSAWLDVNAAVEQMTWAPGLPMLIRNRLISDGGWIERHGCTVFNLYRPPSIVPIAGDVAPWLNLVRNVFPNEADHIVMWVAQRVQRPHEKINHASCSAASLA
jgi:hypothetical protein